MSDNLKYPNGIPEDLLKDPAVRKAMEKAHKKQEREAKRRKENEALQKETIDPETGEKVVLQISEKEGLTPRQQKKADKKAEQMALALAHQEDRLVQRTFVDVVDIRLVVRDRRSPGYGLFQLKDGSYMEILHIRGKSLQNSLDSDIEITESLYMEFLRRCTFDIKFIALNAPLNTRAYQQELQEYQRNTDNPAYREMLQEIIEQYQRMDMQTIKRQLFLCIYAKTLDEIQKVKSYLAASPIPVYEMPIAQQELVLKKQNNLLSAIDI